MYILLRSRSPHNAQHCTSFMHVLLHVHEFPTRLLYICTSVHVSCTMYVHRNMYNVCITCTCMSAYTTYAAYSMMVREW